MLALEADARRPKKDRRTALMLFKEILNEGYTGGYTIVCDFVRNWRNQGSQSKSAYVSLKFALGEAFQFDWSEEWLVIGGIHRKVLAAHTKLCASRAFMLSGYPSQSHEMLFDAHTRAFTAFGGVPKRGIYDNMKTAVRPRCCLRKSERTAMLAVIQLCAILSVTGARKVARVKRRMCH